MSSTCEDRSNFDIEKGGYSSAGVYPWSPHCPAMAGQTGSAVSTKGPTTRLLPAAGRRRGADGPAEGERRTKLRHYDLLAAQTLNPMGTSGLEAISDRDLWPLLCKGSRHAAVFSEICLQEPARRAVALSRFAKVYTEAICRIKDSPHAASLFMPEVLNQVKDEADDMLKILENFDQDTRSVAYTRAGAAARHDHVTMQTAIRDLHQWLSQESLLRSFISFMAGGGCYWSAYAHERAIRAFVSVGEGTTEDFSTAIAASRLSTGDNAGADPEAVPIAEAAGPR